MHTAETARCMALALEDLLGVLLRHKNEPIVRAARMALDRYYSNVEAAEDSEETEDFFADIE